MRRATEGKRGRHAGERIAGERREAAVGARKQGSVWPFSRPPAAACSGPTQRSPRTHTTSLGTAPGSGALLLRSLLTGPVGVPLAAAVVVPILFAQLVVGQQADAPLAHAFGRLVPARPPHGDRYRRPPPHRLTGTRDAHS